MFHGYFDIPSGNVKMFEEAVEKSNMSCSATKQIKDGFEYMVYYKKPYELFFLGRVYQKSIDEAVLKNNTTNEQKSNT